MSRLLFLTSGPIGDCVLSSGALEHARTRLGGAPRVTIACGPAAAELFRAVPNLERVIPLVKRPFGGHWFRLWGEVAAQRWDLAVDLRGSLLTHTLPVAHRIAARPRGEGHKTMQLARVLGVPGPLAPHLHLDGPAFAAAAAAIPGRGFLALGPGAKFPGKRWPAERFAALPARLGLQAVVLGSGAEAQLCAEVAAACGGVSLAGRLDLLASAALLTRARLFIGNDSGLMHLAAAAGAPTIGLFGPSDEGVYAPSGPRAMAIRGETPYAALRARGWDTSAPSSLLADLALERVEAAARTSLEKTAGDPALNASFF